MTQPINAVAPPFGADAAQTLKLANADPAKTVHGTSAVAKTADPPKTANPQEPAATPVTEPTTSPTKLVVERSKDLPTFIYKIVDRTSGEVLSEFPREAAQSLAKAPTYSAGDVVDETA